MEISNTANGYMYTSEVQERRLGWNVNLGQHMVFKLCRLDLSVRPDEITKEMSIDKKENRFQNLSQL